MRTGPKPRSAGIYADFFHHRTGNLGKSRRWISSNPTPLPRYRDQEFRLAAGHRSHANGAAMGLDGALDDRQAEAGSLDFLLRMMLLDSEKAPENVRQIRAGNADAVVG